jgi:hypothetical protein
MSSRWVASFAGVLMLTAAAWATDHGQEALRLVVKQDTATGKATTVWVSKTPPAALPALSPIGVGGRLVLTGANQAGTANLGAALWKANGTGTPRTSRGTTTGGSRRSSAAMGLECGARPLHMRLQRPARAGDDPAGAVWVRDVALHRPDLRSHGLQPVLVEQLQRPVRGPGMGRGVPERQCGAPSPGIQRLGPRGASWLVIGRYSNH